MIILSNDESVCDLYLQTILDNCETPYFQNLVVQNQHFHKQGALEPSVLRLRVLQPYVPLRVTSSASVPCCELLILYNGQLQTSSFAII